MSFRVLLRSCALLACAARVSAWTTTTQARFGTSLSRIVNESNGIGTGNTQGSLGYLWSLPASSTDHTGLGGSITWAWDPNLCTKLLPKFNEDFWGISFISCASLKASMHRAFATWGANHRHIKFTEVTDVCAAEGQLHSGCTRAEVWVTSLINNPSSTAPLEAALAVPNPRFSTTFRYTNGLQPYIAFGAFKQPRSVPEVIGGTISFQTDSICWYLDSDFCSA